MIPRCYGVLCVLGKRQHVWIWCKELHAGNLAHVTCYTEPAGLAAVVHSPFIAVTGHCNLHRRMDGTPHSDVCTHSCEVLPAVRSLL